MRISGLWEQSGVAVPTIKFYLREGLLPPGVPTGRNQAEYDDTHIERLRLIRILTGVGRLTLSEVRQILATLDSGIGSPTGAAPRRLGVAATVAEADQLFRKLGWPVAADAPELDTIAYVLDALRQLGCDVDGPAFTGYAQAAARVAEVRRDCGAAGPDIVAARSALVEVALLELLRLAARQAAAPSAS